MRVRDADGSEDTLVADAVISAVGQLNRPQLPDIAGRDTLRRSGVPLGPLGPRRSTSRGKRVAVIGTGASAVQFIPEIAPSVGELLVFQRTPPWIGADARLPRRRSPTGCAWLYAHVPVVQRVEPLLDLLARWATARCADVTVDPDWESDGAVGERR